MVWAFGVQLGYCYCSFIKHLYISSLHTLNISWTSLEIDAIREFSNYVNENMSRLNIAGCRTTITDDGEIFYQQSETFPHIHEDMESFINFFCFFNACLFPVLRKIVSRCTKLRELDLSDCTALTSDTIDIVANLQHLEYLSLSRCYNIHVSAYL